MANSVKNFGDLTDIGSDTLGLGNAAQKLVKDPSFQRRPWAERHTALMKTDPPYARLPRTKQAETLNRLKEMPYWNPEAGGGASAGTSIKQGPAKWKKTASKIYTPVLEGLGMAAGGAFGATGGGVAGLAGGPAAPGTVPYGAYAGGIAGAGLGYAGGKKAAQGLDVALGLGTEKPRPNTLAGASLETLRDIGTGATMEMGGQVGGALLTRGINTLYKAGQKGMPFSDTRNQYRAAQQFARAQEAGTPEAATANRLRSKQTKELTNRLKPAVAPTPGQAAGNYRSAALEQSLSSSSKNSAFAERLKYNDAELNRAAVNNLTTTLGKPAELPATQPAAMTGESQVKTIKRAMAPVLSKEAQMWSEVPTYPMPASNTVKAFDIALNTPSTARKAIRSVAKVFEQTPRTVEGLQTIEREINSAMKTGTDTDRHFLRQIKSAVQSDFDAMGAAAERGDIALSDGQIVYPSKLRAELKDAQTQAAEARRQLTLPSTKDPNIQAAVGKQVQAAEQRVEALQNQISNLTPAEDVAAKYAAAKKYSREEKFERFYRGAVQDVLESGEQASGMRIPAEQVPAKFFTPTGSKDLIRAVGKEAAAEQSMPHVTDQLIGKTVDANTGIMNIPRASAWIRQNKATLDNLGLTPAVERIVKGQVPRAIEAELETKAVDVLGNPSATTLQAAKLIKKFGPAVEKMYGAKGIQALKDYGQMMEVIGRNKYVSYSKGSTTAEKMMGADLAEKVSALAAVTTGHGWTFSATKNIAKSLMGPLTNFSKEQINAILQEALVNPEAAEVLMKIAKANPRTVSEQAAKWLKPIINQMQIAGKGIADDYQTEQTQEEAEAKRLEEELARPSEAAPSGGDANTVNFGDLGGQNNAR